MKGPQITYYIAEDEGEPAGLFRKIQDDGEKTLTLERLDENGQWVDDPKLIDEIQGDPEVREVTDPDELMEIRKALYFDPSHPDFPAVGDDEEPSSGPDDPAAAATPPAAPAQS